MQLLLAQSDYPGLEGFLGGRGSLMLDIVFLAMFAVVPAMAVSIYLVKLRRRHLLHKWIQVTLGAVLLAAVAAFEVDMRLHGWRERAAPSPYYESNLVDAMLYVHLVFAVPTVVIWACVIIAALRQFPNPPTPGKHSRRHKLWGWIAAIEMTMTAVTGWIFYWMAFVAM
ncbi:MAG: DUF420 domain-containing protein [Planctomycetes bacterium]|nr:DUF420 domain-containing protein [Planctomycetota bacterium]